MNKICIVITTFLRDELLYKSIQSIVDNYQSNWQLIIIDQNNESENLTFKKIFKSKLIANYVSFEWIHVPYNSGLSYGRNIGVQKAKELDCEYVIIWSDSFLANESLDKINYLVENQLFGYDLIGFELKGSICGWEAKINLIPTKAFQLEFIKKEQQFSKHPDFLLLDCELCRNIFIAKTDTLLSSPWDNILKLCEHESIHGNSPILLKDRNGIYITPIKYLMTSQEPDIKKSSTESKKHLKNYHIWTDEGWSKIKYITRHPCIKKMYRILTSTGYIECTADHSLIINNKIINPESLKIGDKLENCTYPTLSNKINYNHHLAWVLGFFLADGGYSKMEISPKHIQENTSFSNTKKSLLLQCQNFLKEFGIESNIKPLKIGYKNSYNKKEMYRLNVIGENKNLANLLFSKFYFKDRKLIPSFIYNFDKESRLAFLTGFISGDGHICKSNREGSYKISQKEACIIEGLKYLSNDIWFSTLNYAHHNNELYYKLNINKSNKRVFKKNIIKKIEVYDYDGFVYDIETENHHFCGGIGNVNLHNSFFYEYKQKGYKVGWTNLIVAEKMKDRPDEYAEFRRINFVTGQKYLKEKYKIKSWVEYVNLDEAKKGY